VTWGAPLAHASLTISSPRLQTDIQSTGNTLPMSYMFSVPSALRAADDEARELRAIERTHVEVDDLT
jgi:hypothetical protein